MMSKPWIVGWWVCLLAVVTQPSGMAGETPPSLSPSPKAAAALQLLESKDAYQRQLAFLRLEALREPATVEPIRAYVEHRDPDVRAYALRALAAIQGAEAVPFLLQRLSRERQPRVRRAILLGLEPFSKARPDLIPLLIGCLRDRSTEVRMAAVDIVSRIDDPKAREAILLRHRKERRRDVRRVLDLAIKRLRS